jgi:putative FmdB family regulatory protein
MPLYEYYCPPCGEQFELLRPVKQMNDAATCPSGHTTNNRVLSLFAPLQRGDEVPAMTMPMMGGGDACGSDGCCC